jgi:CheY-like chemotaxis protein
VSARSDGPGRGSAFVVRLPLAASGVGIPSRMEPSADASAGQRRVLVADDNPDAAESLAMMLRMLGHVVRTASDGAQAVQAAAEFNPDVALLDIGMPHVNGYEAARRIRSANERVLLVALTGWGQAEDKRKAIEAGFDEHLVKPADVPTLQAVLARRAPGFVAASSRHG